MRILLFFLASLIVLISTVYFLRLIRYSDTGVASPTVAVSATPTAVELKVVQAKRSLFIPYWTLAKKAQNLSSYDRYIYFGIATSKTGLDQSDPGYGKIEEFGKFVPKKSEKYIAVRMINSEVNFSVLRDKKAQTKIIDESVVLAKDSSFDGIVLDLETASLSFDSVVNRISNFIQEFSKAAHSKNLKFAVSLYGDAFYRSRPYDVAVIGKSVDEILIMAYDFHKSRGNPGPNFPLNGREKYGYDFKKMVDEYLQVVPSEKLSVIFGIYGYDWVVDTKNQSIKNGIPLSANEIGQKYNFCIKKGCMPVHDAISTELHISYTDGTFQHHEIWFENLDSIQEKQKYLTENKIYSTAFWAYSYF